MKTALFLILGSFYASQVAFSAPETFKLYNTPNAQVNRACDVFTQLILNAHGNSASAKLSDQVQGSCEIYRAPSNRSYRLVLAETDCGSKIYRQDGFIEIIDNRGRICTDVVPGRIVVKEYNPAINQYDFLFSEN